MTSENRLYLAGEWLESESTIEVRNPFNQQPITACFLASPTHINSAIEKALDARNDFHKLSSGEIAEILLQIAAKLEANRVEIARLIAAESGKPLRYAEGEVLRGIATFRIASEECKRPQNELIELDWTDSGRGKRGKVVMKSCGIAAGIAPFNFPLNLVAHKIAPAIASRTPIILKPSSSTPLTALFLAKLIDEVSLLPKGALSVLPCSREVGQLLVEDDRIHILSFTGSPEVGWKMKREAGKKKVVLELGGNAAAIVHKDADINEAIDKLFTGAFAYSGQVCIHTQRIYLHADIEEAFISGFVARIKILENSDPAAPSCLYSVMIDENNAERVHAWINEAIQDGATCISGGVRQGNFVEPTVCLNTTKNMKIHAEEVFGPVVCVNVYTDLDEVIAQVNDSRFGLQASVFTDSKRVLDACFDRLEVGAVIHNDSTLFRVDHMPYGGVKDSGRGREGVRYAMLDFMEPRLLVE
jgi:acyl-CoA reductase-like NAD-dependent aldehyde dehydrogenase